MLQAGVGATPQSTAPLLSAGSPQREGQIYGGGSYVTSITQNTGYEQTKGWDIEANYKLNWIAGR